MTPDLDLDRTPVGALSVGQLLRLINDAGAVAAPSPSSGARLLRPGQAAKRLGCSLDTLSRWRREERLPAVEVAPGVFRYDPDALDAWLSARTTTRSTETLTSPNA